MTDLGTIMQLGIIGAGLLLILTFWTIAWKGIALWIAAQEKSKKWFIAILVFNTFGILEIIYILGFSSRGKKYIADRKAKRAAKKYRPTQVESEALSVKEEPKTPSEQ